MTHVRGVVARDRGPRDSDGVAAVVALWRGQDEEDHGDGAVAVPADVDVVAVVDDHAAGVRVGGVAEAFVVHNAVTGFNIVVVTATTVTVIATATTTTTTTTTSTPAAAQVRLVNQNRKLRAEAAAAGARARDNGDGGGGCGFGTIAVCESQHEEDQGAEKKPCQSQTTAAMVHGGEA